jgi:fibro-slime domain-containing protein
MNITRLLTVLSLIVPLGTGTLTSCSSSPTIGGGGSVDTTDGTDTRGNNDKGDAGTDPDIFVPGPGGGGRNDAGTLPPACRENPDQCYVAGDAGPACGDGVVDDGEECDDGNSLPGDGCNGACKVEPFYDCGDGTKCVFTIVCGDGVVDRGEVCDDGNTKDGDGCSADCTQQDASYVCIPGQACQRLYECGDGRVNGSDECDDGNTKDGDGCDSKCKLEDGFRCPSPGNPCVERPVCGNKKRETGEQCDDGNTSRGDGCTETCRLEKDWECNDQGECRYTPECGDGKVSGNDGCSDECTVIDEGYVCERPGFACRAICGDGLVRGTETCDDGNLVDNDGCSSSCRREPRYGCTTPANGPSVCTLAVCGNGVREGDEACDDGNTIAGDGCGPTCQHEPTFDRVLVNGHYEPVARLTCGDGLKTGDEECDDGNIADNDGCSSDCKEEPGYECDESIEYPNAVQFKVVYRDFKQRSAQGGHPHMKVSNTNPPNTGADLGIVGALCTPDNQANCGRLDVDGKPVYAGGNHLSIDNDNFDVDYHRSAFGLWYRDTNTTVYDITGNNLIQIAPNPGLCAGGTCNTAPAPETAPFTLTLGKVNNPNDPDVASPYRFSQNNNTFYPLGSNVNGNMIPSRGFGFVTADGENRNWHFTSELRYFFQYQGGEELVFFGDDDVWVFVNGRLAVDIGGIHSTAWGRVVLGDEDSTCTWPKTTSQFNTQPSSCSRSAEEVDDLTDNRFNITKGGVYEIVVFQAERHPMHSNYQLTLSGFLAPRSVCHTICGDGVPTPDEECDDGEDNTTTPQYDKCTTSCELGPFCGDGVKNGDEECDNGVNISGWGDTDPNACAPGCKAVPTCGDGQLDPGFEECDNGQNNVASGYGECTTECTVGAFCGDGVRDTEHGETCDDGVNDGQYGSCNLDCTPGPRCGDGIVQAEWGEQCDGQANCSDTCRLGAQCGDGIVQSELGEECDDGDNAGGYGQCAPSCLLGPYCGDGVVQSQEQCDDGENNGGYGECAAGCRLGDRCGDGIVQTEFGEECDDGNSRPNDGCSPTCRKERRGTVK